MDIIEEIYQVWAAAHAQTNCECNTVIIPLNREKEIFDTTRMPTAYLYLERNGKYKVFGCEIIFAHTDKIKAGYLQ